MNGYYDTDGNWVDTGTAPAASNTGSWTMGGILSGLTGLAGAVIPAFRNGGAQNNQAALQAQATAAQQAAQQANTKLYLIIGAAVLGLIAVAFLIFRKGK